MENSLHCLWPIIIIDVGQLTESIYGMAFKSFSLLKIGWGETIGTRINALICVELTIFCEKSPWHLGEKIILFMITKPDLPGTHVFMTKITKFSICFLSIVKIMSNPKLCLNQDKDSQEVVIISKLNILVHIDGEVSKSKSKPSPV